MTARGRNVLWFILLLALFILGAERMAASLGFDIETPKTIQTKGRSDPPSSPPVINQEALRQAARLVPIYPAGSLVVEAPPEPPSQTKESQKARLPEPVETPAPSPLTANVGAERASTPTMSLKGELPALEVDYQDIGFNRYLDVSERIGRFFVLVEGEDGRTMRGPEVSLIRGVVSQATATDLAPLAMHRPNLVSGDPTIRQRLSAIQLPPGTRTDSLILYLTKPFDSVLWGAIADTVAKHGLQLADVDRISGRYVLDRRGVSLRLETAILRKNGRALELSRLVKVTL